MGPTAAVAPGPPPASLVVVDPSGHRTRVPIDPLPFQIGRMADNRLVIRDSRVSRVHARISAVGDHFVVEDCGSTHGTFVNGQRIARHTLKNSDRIEFGTPDSYQLIFTFDGAELKRLLEHVGAPDSGAYPQGLGNNLAKLRAILDLARTVQSSFSVDDVLASVVDTALAITGAERGFLLLRRGDGLETRVARHKHGHKLQESDLRVPREVIHHALQHRRELLSMNFDPVAAGQSKPQSTISDLDLRSVTCVPLVRIRTALGEATSVLSAGNETVGVLYMDSRVAAADMAGGNRELLQTLAIEASTVLENARLLEEEQGKHQLEDELKLARTIQQSLLPGKLPTDGWLRVAGSSVASHEVGGDYFDVAEVNPQTWSVVVADVSGKGVGSALLAALLQGALITATDHSVVLGRRMERLNHFLLERTSGEKYATIFYSLVERGGSLSYVNAAHCPPMLVRAGGIAMELVATGRPVGLLEESTFEVANERLLPGDKVVIYSDGVTEAQNARGEFFGKKRLREIVTSHAQQSCTAIHDAIQEGVSAFAEGARQSDDITVVVMEYEG
jgi:serine phosphatase RsbU (regulator of sigma subunit)/pSer/pThr/pTyr-binding forkhead associated (FHA) protein